LMHMMLYKGGKIHNIPEIMSCYRVTGRGVWTSKSIKEQAEANRRIVELISHSLPFKYRILVFLQKVWRRLLKKIKNLFFGPVIE